MIASPSRLGAFAVYQLVLLVGILAMPVALATRRLGVRLPLGDLVAAATRTYENAG